MNIVLYVMKCGDRLLGHGYEWEKALTKRKGGHSKFASTSRGYQLPASMITGSFFVEVINYVDIHVIKKDIGFEDLFSELKDYTSITLISSDVSVQEFNEIENVIVMSEIDDSSDYWKQLNSMKDILLEETTMLKVDGNKYWRFKLDKPDLMHGHNIYSTTINNPGVYYTLAYKETLEIGANDGNVNYNVVVLNEPMSVIEDMRKRMDDILGTDLGPYVIHLNVLRNKVVLNLQEMYKDYLDKLITVTTFDRHRAKIPRIFIADFKVASLLYPPNLAIKTLDKLDNLSRVLRDGVNCDKTYMCEDITEKLYYNGKIREDFKQVTKLMKFTIVGKNSKYKIPIVFGVDTLDRNAFKRLEKKHPKVTLLTRDFGTSLQYWTIIETDIGTCICACVHGNTVLNLNRK